MPTTTIQSQPAFSVGAVNNFLRSTGRAKSMTTRAICAHTVPVKALQRRCPQRAAELIYLKLLADLQLAHFDKSTTFRDKFAASFSTVCPNEKHHWMSFYVRCQAKLGVKVLKNFEIVFFANDSANAKPVRTKPC